MSKRSLEKVIISMFMACMGLGLLGMFLNAMDVDWHILRVIGCAMFLGAGVFIGLILIDVWKN